MKKFLQFVLPSLNEQDCFFITLIDNNGILAKPFTDVAAAEAFAQRNLHKAVYFTPLTFTKGKRRLQSNAQRCRALFADMDCGPDKPFNDKQHAATSLKAFCVNTGVPNPNCLVDSGNGLHAYWVFEPVLTKDEWQPIADAFKALAKRHALKIDPTVTADAARVLRLPGSTNYKNGERKVRVIHAKPRFPSWDVMTKSLPSAQPSQVPAHLLNVGIDEDDMLGVVSSAPDALFANIAKQCAQCADVLATGGKHCSEPMWHDTLLLVRHCSDWSQYVHAVSDQHSGYDFAKTDAKVQHIIDAGYKPPLCTTITSHAYNPKLCTDCKHNGKIKTPWVLGVPAAEPSEPPKQYKVSNGTIYTAGEKPERICRSFDLTLEDYVDPGTNAISTVIVFHLPDMQPVPVDYAAIHDVTQFRRVMGSSLVLPKTKMNQFDRLVTSWIGDLRDSNNGYVKIPSQVGWSYDWSSFTFNDRMVRRTGNGAIETVPLHGMSKLPSMTSLTSMHASGSFSTWQEHTQALVDTGVPEMHAVMAASFAAVLTDLISDPPAVLLLISKQSGVGKSTMFRAANSVWFAPDRGINMSDTENYINNVVMSSRHVPIFWDELQLLEDRKTDRNRALQGVVGIIFRTLQGADKGRMNSNATLRHKQTNRPIVAISSNLPLAEIFAEYHMDAPEAMAARTLQVEITNRPSGRFHTNPLNENYGIAGQRFIEYLMGVGKARAQRMVQRVDAMLITPPKPDAPAAMKQLTKVLDGGGRMWRSCMALTMVATRMVNASGVLKLDERQVFRTLAQAAMRTSVSTTKASTLRDPFGILQDILHTADANKEVIRTLQRPIRGTSVPQITSGADYNRLTVWLADGDSWARIRRSVFDEQVRRRRGNPQRVAEFLIGNGVLLERRFAACDPRQTNSALRAPCYDIDLKQLAMLVKKRPV